MNTDYLKYLIYLSLVVFAFGLLSAYLIKRRKSAAKAEVKKADPITAGNISVFFDSQEKVTIIAYVTDLFGVGKATGDPIFLDTSSNDGKLGCAIRGAMNLSSKGVPSTDNELMSSLGFRSWKEFSQGKRNISVHYRKDYGVVINSTIRNPDGAYQFNSFGSGKVVSPYISDMELGKAVKEVLQKCR